MSYEEIVGKIELIKSNYQNGNINGEDLCELLSDLQCDISECESAFGMHSNVEDDYYQSFEETDFTKLEVI